ncbi:MAG: hypothetical protein HC906_03610 [Bacteroidales bacterium]|nr:hypothetical protein [Bacteroidales bacterium]
MVPFSQPNSGDIFREYAWTTPDSLGFEKFIRVCGDGVYYDHADKSRHVFPVEFEHDGWFTLPGNLDLNEAVKVEVVVERMLCHDGSTGLAIKFNSGQWYEFPDADSIPYPQSDYLYHYYPLVKIPLEDLKTGPSENKFRFKINPSQRWGMPQNLVYGMIIRVYYKNTKPHVNAHISTIKEGDQLSENVNLNIQANKPFHKVEYVGLMKDINYEGDGKFYQWHYHYHRGKLINHIGTSSTGEFLWNTEWLPDQEFPIQISARVTDNNGIIFMTNPVKELTLNRKYKVVLCQSLNVPKAWTTREKEFIQEFNVNNPQKVERFIITAVTWGPDYLNGVFLNDFVILDREACRYCYHILKHEYFTPEFLKETNTIKTGKTPLYNNKLVHGCEIQYPGFMVLVRYFPD